VVLGKMTLEVAGVSPAGASTVTLASSVDTVQYSQPSPTAISAGSQELSEAKVLLLPLIYFKALLLENRKRYDKKAFFQVDR